ncbi:Retrovirus-related Pol polyprotein from transposon TNT 1-94 [Sarcoptes scabiei]|uniref:Retrovirus-related Pol polyprotein from transposon TNT 1-94 n=1 Tax=Sarcoptes scabiei TaxID=52283 RepID=A0A834RJR0_SARSC|nr:Retrovirus-related Pol polyprotein from transposon TNT 1-94 [Sarcoptes scabiei]
MIKHLWRYLKGTIDYGISLGGNSKRIIAFSDSDLAGDLNCKTTAGWCIFYNGPIIWKSKLQKCIIDNTSEAEFIAASLASKDVRFVANILEELGIEIEQMKLKCDNQFAVRQMVSPSLSPRLGHIKIKLLMLRDLTADQILTVEWVKSDDKIADVLTKLLPKELH